MSCLRQTDGSSSRSTTASVASDIDGGGASTYCREARNRPSGASPKERGRSTLSRAIAGGRAKAWQSLKRACVERSFEGWNCRRVPSFRRYRPVRFARKDPDVDFRPGAPS